MPNPAAASHSSSLGLPGALSPVVANADLSAASFQVAPEAEALSRRYADHARSRGRTSAAFQHLLPALAYNPTNQQMLAAILELARLPEIAQDKRDFLRFAPPANAPRMDEVAPFLTAVIQFAFDQGNPTLALAATERASGLKLRDATSLLGGLVEAFISRIAKPKHQMQIHLKLTHAYEEAGLVLSAVECCRAALGVARADQSLQEQIGVIAGQLTQLEAKGALGRMSAQSRENVVDEEHQRRLDMGDRTNRTEDQQAEHIAAMRAAFKATPRDLAVRRKLVAALRQTRNVILESEAIDLLLEAYRSGNESDYSLREDAGKIRIEQAKRRVKDLEGRIDAGERELADHLGAARSDLRSLELEEAKATVAKYPAGRAEAQFKLGELHFAAGEHDKAIEILQQVQKEPKLGARALLYIGRAFFELKMFTEAIMVLEDEGLKRLQGKGEEGDLLKSFQYHLVCVLEAKAREENDVSLATEALKLVARILAKDFTFSDLKGKRQRLMELREELLGKKAMTTSRESETH